MCTYLREVDTSGKPICINEEDNMFRPKIDTINVELSQRKLYKYHETIMKRSLIFIDGVN